MKVNGTHPSSRLRRGKYRATTSLLAIGMCAALATPATAQETVDEEAELDTVVVIGSVSNRGKNPIEASISVSSVGSEEIQNFGATSTGDLLRNLPGYRAEAKSGEGNANIASRGLPAPDGGARYVQLQEDGLPVVLYGDIAFGNADFYIRADNTIDRVESLRGGSAAVLYSNAPGGAINIVSKTGEDEGGSIALSSGLTYDEFRTDFEYGGPINEAWRFHIGGFYRNGEGLRELGYNGNDGGQIKANLTRDFENGYARLYFKHLNDNTFGLQRAPALADGSSLPGYDIGDDAQYSVNIASGVRINGSNQIESRDYTEGNEANSTAIGGEFSFDLDHGINLTNRFRVNKSSGDQLTFFTFFVSDLQTIADAVGGAGSTLAFANGPNAGQAIDTSAGAPLLNGNGLAQWFAAFDTEVESLDSFSNDLQLSKDFTDNFRATAGYYRASQDLAINWHWNGLVSEVRGDNAALLNVFDSTGAAATDNGITSYAGVFGDCCKRNYDLEYTIDAPYLDFELELDRLTLNAGVRHESGDVTGTFLGGGFPGTNNFVPIDVNGDGSISSVESSVATLDLSAAVPIDFDYSRTSYSAGANYLITDDFSVFGRYSRGYKANVDRIISPNNVLADGSIEEDVVTDEVTQAEAGVKYITSDLSLFATGFWAESAITSFDPTNPAGSRLIDQEVEALGLELEGSYQRGPFALAGNLTWTDSEIQTGPNAGNTPQRQADLVYSITPQVFIEQINLNVGANIIGTTESFGSDANTFKQDGFVQTNLFANLLLTDDLQLTVNVNNLFDEEGVTEVDGGGPATVTVQDGTQFDILPTLTIPGLNARATITYRF